MVWQAFPCQESQCCYDFYYLISTALSGNPCLSTWREFRIQEWILLDSCQYQTFPLYTSLPPVISEEFINSQSKGVYAQPWFGFLFPANTIWIPRATTQWKNALYIDVALTFTAMKGLFFLCQSIKDNLGCLYITAPEKKRRNRQIWYTGNRMRPVSLDARDL